MNCLIRTFPLLLGALISSACSVEGPIDASTSETADTETDDGSQMSGPMSGIWAFHAGVLNDPCSNVPPNGFEPVTTFVLDYDGGDQFEIETEENDAVCDMNGTAFSCIHTRLYIFPQSDIDVSYQYEVSWSGEFSSPTSIVDGLEIVTITCSGSDCPSIENLPCSRETMFTAEFQS